MPLGSSGSMSHMVPSLVMAASAANDLMPLSNGMPMESDMNLSAHGMQGMSDGKFFHPQGRHHWPNIQPNSLDPMLQDHGKEQMHANDQLNKGMGQQRPLAMSPGNQTHFTTDFSMNQKPVKPKVRGRFTDSRRKEVQEVRKRGACIRCRMLKKPVGQVWERCGFADGLTSISVLGKVLVILVGVSRVLDYGSSRVFGLGLLMSWSFIQQVIGNEYLDVFAKI